MTERKIELRILKIILWVYIILCILIAGLNYGYAAKASAKVGAFITWFWHFYENVIKTLFIIVCSILTIRIVRVSKRTAMRKRNLIGFTITALVVHIFGPMLLNNSELYFFTMPLPWTTTPLQLLYENSPFYISRYPIWGLTGITIALIFFVCFSLIVLVGTLLFGRRWQCSTLCLFNGFAAEIFEPAIPLIGKKKPVSEKKLKIFSYLRWIFLGLAVFFTLWWTLFLLNIPIPGNYNVLSKIENYKYLLFELLTAMFFWVAFIGRGYCYYCPVGTLLAYVGKFSGQKIKTDETNCIKCNRCNQVCPMTIQINEKAEKKESVSHLNCVGCGHCVDNCPTKTLTYSTWFIDKIKKK